MRRWELRSLPPSSQKLTAREPGAAAPRVAAVGRQTPRVLFSSPECRAVVLDLAEGEGLGDHQVHERATLEVVAGRVTVEWCGESFECESGTLVMFEPGERHAVRALSDARLLLLLTPWPAPGPRSEPATEQREHLAVNARSNPLPS